MTSTLRVNTIQHGNSTEAATIDASGNMTFAKNISQTGLQYWSGYHNTSATYGAGSTITNWSKEQGSGITHSLGVWTIPVAGVYLFSISVLTDTAAGGIYWHVNSTQKWRIGYSGSTDWQNQGGTLMYQFSANDTLKFTMQSGSTQVYGDSKPSTVSAFGIFKVG